MSRSDLLFYAGGECFAKYGTPSRRTHPSEDVAETFTRTGTAYYVDRAGVLKIAEANALRTEWTGALFDTPVLLLEDARTNEVTFSEELDNGAWTKLNSSISADAIAAPDGATTADKIVEDGTASAQHGIERAQTIVADTINSITWFAKAGERTKLEVQIDGGAGTNKIVGTYDLSAGTVAAVVEGGAVSGGFVRIAALANSWYRCTLGGIITGDTSVSLRVKLHDGSRSTYNGDSSSGAYVWGIQYEENAAFESSYIQTVGSTVTRNAETLSFPFPFKPQEMTVYAKFIEAGTAAENQSLRLWHIGSAGIGTDPRMEMEAGSGIAYRVFHDNGTTAVSSNGTGAPSIGDTVETRAVLATDGSVVGAISINSGAESVGSASAANTIVSPWAGQLLYVNSGGTSNRGWNRFHAIKIARGTKTLAQMRALGV